MKSLKYYVLSALVLFGVLETAAQPSPETTITYQGFYDALSPYGHWVGYPDYGIVWHPDVSDFRPYCSDGYWEYTESGWYWFSAYEWGWAPFHYGRWFYDDSFGWLWEPGYEWSPAWVTWGITDDYYAWAPLAPWVDAASAYSDWMPNNFYWNMVPKNRLADPELSRYVLPIDEVRDKAAKLTIMTDFVRPEGSAHSFVARGPEARAVRQASGQEVRAVMVHDHPLPAKNTVNNREISVFRPVVLPPGPSVVRQIHPSARRPVYDEAQWPVNNPAEQQRHIQSLPLREQPFEFDIRPADAIQRGPRPMGGQPVNVIPIGGMRSGDGNWQY